MKITDPRPFLDAIDQIRLKEILGASSVDEPKSSPVYVEPGQRSSQPTTAPKPDLQPRPVSGDENLVAEHPIKETPTSEITRDIRKGKVQVLGDFIDTDAVSAICAFVDSKMLITQIACSL